MARKTRDSRKKPALRPKQAKAKRKLARPTLPNPDPPRGPSCPVVGVGASAGGLEAFQEFLSGLPDNTGLAFVLVQHLSPQHKSMLEELLRRHSKMPVAEIKQDTPIQPNRIYVIPPNATLTVQGSRLHLAPAKKRDGRMPIDDFFSSLAETMGERAACVVLSGTGSDGTLGLRAIKEHGGFSMAQTEESAKYDGMLRSAIATGLVDYVLPAEEMAGKLVEYFRHLTEVDGQKDADGVSRETTAYLGRILTVLGSRTKHDFTGYKEKTVARRVQRRMQALQIGSPEQYLKRLRTEPREIDLLFQDLLINVTNFFRDPEAFEALDTHVISHLMQSGKSSIRVWVPGCATGEEAYSIGILLRERMAQIDNPPRVQIFATDIDDNALETARLGRYPLTIAKDVSPERLERFFVKDEGAYRVVKDLREMCIFSLHNVLRDPPFSKQDLVSCRNLLIYLNAPIQSRLLQIFHYALRPGGFLFLGNTESVAQQPLLFANLDKTHHIYSWRPHAEAQIRFPLATSHAEDKEGEANRPKAEAKRSVAELAEHVVLSYAPAYVVINADQSVLSFSPRTGKYLEHPAGAPNVDLLQMARRGLRLDLRAAINKAIQTGRRAVQPDVAVQINGGTQRVNIIVQPFGAGGGGREGTLFVVIFQDMGEIKLEAEGIVDETNIDASGVQQLENELRLAHAQRQSITEELEATNEELKSSNEELSSMNEELQSTNEELETSKEELQSINEELQTINTQLQSSNEDLRRANSDMKNLLESTQIATLFLDGEMRIKSFTPAVADMFYIVAGDMGRPLNHIRTRLETSDFEADCRRVMRTLAVVERQVRLADHGASYVMRIMPYRTVDNVIDGVVLTFFDITERQKHEQERALLAAIVDSSTDAIYSVSLDGIVTSWNSGAEKLLGYTSEEAVGRSKSFTVPPDRASEVALIDARARAGERVEALQTVRQAKDGRLLDVSLVVSPIRDADGKVTSISIIARDIADRKRVELQRVMMAELNHRVKNSLAIVTALARRTMQSSETAASFVSAFEGRLKSFGRTHDALSHENWAGLDMRQLVLSELKPYKGGERTRVEGPPVLLRPKAALAFGMTVHELASNAVKFGPLAAAGRVDVSWELTDGAKDPRLSFRWNESGGPRVAPPTHSGLGRKLIEELMEYELGAKTNLTFEPGGVQCVIDVPLTRDVGEVTAVHPPAATS
ncbi:MAG TPA: chemotaxis protein CheB [Methylomirabilota bacterium]|nr:chemotaxis protein CheB [Methylomirabilota bacterium]